MNMEIIFNGPFFKNRAAASPAVWGRRFVGPFL